MGDRTRMRSITRAERSNSVHRHTCVHHGLTLPVLLGRSLLLGECDERWRCSRERDFSSAVAISARVARSSRNCESATFACSRARSSASLLSAVAIAFSACADQVLAEQRSDCPRPCAYIREGRSRLTGWNLPFEALGGRLRCIGALITSFIEVINAYNHLTF